MRKKGREKKNDAPVLVEESSGNVFADLGLKDPEELLAKAELVEHIGDIIDERKLTQVRAAEILGIDQPKVSTLLRGKLDGFSTDRLFRFLNALGSDVEIVIRPARRGEAAETRVVTACARRLANTVKHHDAAFASASCAISPLVRKIRPTDSFTMTTTSRKRTKFEGQK